MKVAYVAGKYRSPTVRGVVENIQAAEAVALDLWQMGYAAICPHKNSALFDGAAPDEVWLDGYLEILRRCDLVVLVPGWEQSDGTWAEIREAFSLGIPVFHSDNCDGLGEFVHES